MVSKSTETQISIQDLSGRHGTIFRPILKSWSLNTTRIPQEPESTAHENLTARWTIAKILHQLKRMFK